MIGKSYRALVRFLDNAIVVSLLVILITGLHAFGRVLVCDRFTVRGRSMEPTLHDGQKVWVYKFILGARIYTKFDFDSSKLSCFRMPGLRKLQVGDVAVFNYPRCGPEDAIGFKINYVYAKRCVGAPGDTVWIKDCHVVNSSQKHIGLPVEVEERLRQTPDSLLLATSCLRSGHFAGKESTWTIKEMGPIVVPGRDHILPLNPETVAMYSLIIRYETGFAPKISDNIVLLNGVPAKEYHIREDYYLFFGDNPLDSKDSRYIGFVPEKYIVGIIGRGKEKS